MAHAAPSLAQRFVPQAPLKPGQFIWAPERAPAGPVVVIVSLPEQLVHVYRGGVEIGTSSCSTGKPGHRTPTGVFTILEKARTHVSSLYKGAQMPNMERLTWGGIALHAGNLPGYPASHGCVRMPLAFSAALFTVTHLGTAVIIADERTQPANVVHPGVMLPSVAEIEARALTETVAKRPVPGAWQATVHYPVTSVLISRADGMAYVTHDGRVESRHPVRIANPQARLGTHVYSVVGPAADGSGLLWLAFGIGRAPTEAHVVQWQGESSLRRISFHDMAEARRVAQSLHPGTTLMITDASAPRETRGSSSDFAVLASEAT